MNNEVRKPRIDPTQEDKLKAIFSECIKNGECLEWTRGYFRRPNGNETYPQIYYKSKSWRGNRLVLFLSTGQMHKNLHALHTCDNTRCVNPKHLYWGTHQDNMNDLRVRKRSPYLKINLCPSGHPYSGNNLRIGKKDGKRYCKSCHWYTIRGLERRPEIPGDISGR